MGGDALRDVLKQLCMMFKFATQSSNHPLMNGWDSRVYAQLIWSKHSSVERFRALSNICVDEGLFYSIHCNMLMIANADYRLYDVSWTQSVHRKIGAIYPGR